MVCSPFFTGSSATRSKRYSARPRITFIGVPISCAIPEATVPSSATRSVRRQLFLQSCAFGDVAKDGSQEMVPSTMTWEIGGFDGEFFAVRAETQHRAQLAHFRLVTPDCPNLLTC